ncbi:MAG TPA: hypothetical protein VN736_01910 [Candidatus Limnocylindrales bacterium]|nr:hypothetical protein [Candidatus Limnocylindrales bacterium]
MRLAVLLVAACTLAAQPRAAIQDVYDKLTESSGALTNFPRLVVTPGRPSDPGDLAFYQHAGAITVSEHLYDLCVQVTRRAGTPDAVPDCLSVILGHELSHFLHGDEWAADVLPEKGLVNRDAGLPQGAGQEQADVKRRDQEAHADFDAGIYALQAGYDPTPYGPPLLDAIYAEYAANLAGATAYPTLKERIEILKSSYRDLTEEIYPAFEAGVRLYVLGDYDEAAACFAYVGQRFRSPEIFSNEAAARILSAMQKNPKLSGGFIYPTELDLETRLNPPPPGIRALGTDLDAASKALRKALALDPKYAPALVNSAIVASLFDRNSEALARLDDAQSAAGTDAALVRAIVKARSGDTAGAQKDFQSLAALGNHIAALNLKALQRHSEDEVRPAVVTKSPGTERIGGKTVEDHPGASRKPIELGDYTLDVNLALSYRLYQLIADGRTKATLLTTPPNTKDHLLQTFGIGSDINAILKTHPAVRTVPEPQGIFYVLSDPGVLVLANRAGKVTNWTLFR